MEKGKEISHLLNSLDKEQKQSESVQVFNKSFNEISIITHNGLKSRHIVFILITTCFLVFFWFSIF